MSRSHPMLPPAPSRLIPLGTLTDFGTVEGIHSRNGERSYFLVDEYGVVTLMPADMLEPKE